MNSYLVKIVYQIICGDGQHAPQFDEQLRLVKAVHRDEAFQKAYNIGRQEEETFYNNNRQLVQWRFVNVAEIYSLAQLADGAEICSQIKETGDAVAYREFVHHKAGLLSGQPDSFTLQSAAVGLTV